MNVELWYEKDVYYEPQEISLLYENGEIKQMDRQEERFYCELDLPPGEYRYRFLIDGELELTKYDLCHHASETAPSVQKKTFFRKRDRQIVARLVFNSSKQSSTL